MVKSKAANNDSTIGLQGKSFRPKKGFFQKKGCWSSGHVTQSAG